MSNANGSNGEEVARLKAIAGEHFKKKDFDKASQIYTEAIALDGKNAILWSNRAACRHSLKQYIGAAWDASKAIELDPEYTKAYGRLALAHDGLKQPWLSSRAWCEAIVTQKLPMWMMRDSMIRNTMRNVMEDAWRPESEQNEKTEYEANLYKAMKAWLMPMVTQLSSPWRSAYAARLMPNEGSCAEYISTAYDEFTKGLEMLTGEMKDDHIDKNCSGPYLYAPKSIVEQLTNAILLDQRVLDLSEIDNPRELEQRICGQAHFEAEIAGVVSWTKGTDLEKIMTESFLRMKQEGWVGDDTWATGLNCALSITIRTWVLSSAIHSQLLHSWDDELEFLPKAIKLIKMGRKEWLKKLKNRDLGVLDLKFLRQVQARYLHALFARHSMILRRTDVDDEALTTLKRMIREVAEEVILSCETDLPKERETKLNKLKYWAYPKGQALALKGFCLNHGDSKQATTKKDKERFLQEAAKAYIDAAECYPDDDEHHTWYLQTAVDIMVMSKTTPAIRVLEILDRIDKAMEAQYMLQNIRLQMNASLTRSELVHKRILVTPRGDVKIVPL
ncbi:hypothetical protein D9758_000725 [Tetrapyrgos nigripes]|uniref:Uncharacterized protein n=1 Tax=Tetrapyrgos nigripes TaxID=182062 RepID=A0A8H5LXJ5_9AGAR|nr:hypothetical protein D9758_000725 [Tetrapyrgos nigripes]